MAASRPTSPQVTAKYAPGFDPGSPAHKGTGVLPITPRTIFFLGFFCIFIDGVLVTVAVVKDQSVNKKRETNWPALWILPTDDPCGSWLLPHLRGNESELGQIGPRLRRAHNITIKTVFVLSFYHLSYEYNTFTVVCQLLNLRT